MNNTRVVEQGGRHTCTYSRADEAESRSLKWQNTVTPSQQRLADPCNHVINYSCCITCNTSITCMNTHLWRHPFGASPPRTLHLLTLGKRPVQGLSPHLSMILEGISNHRIRHKHTFAAEPEPPVTLNVAASSFIPRQGDRRLWTWAAAAPSAHRRERH